MGLEIRTAEHIANQFEKDEEAKLQEHPELYGAAIVIPNVEQGEKMDEPVFVSIQIDGQNDRRTLCGLLADNNYCCWIRKENEYFEDKYFVCFRPKKESEKHTEGKDAKSM